MSTKFEKEPWDYLAEIDALDSAIEFDSLMESIRIEQVKYKKLNVGFVTLLLISAGMQIFVMTTNLNKNTPVESSESVALSIYD